jgi:hypothetical protein
LAVQKYEWLARSYSVHKKAMIAPFQSRWIIIPIRRPVLAHENDAGSQGLERGQADCDDVCS